MSEGWPAQVVNESGVMESMLQQRQVRWLARYLRLSKVQHMLFRGQSLGYVNAPAPPPPPPPRQPKSNSPPSQSLIFCFHLYVFPLTCTAILQLESYSAVHGYIHCHSLQAQTGKACSHDQAMCC